MMHTAPPPTAPTRAAIPPGTEPFVDVEQAWFWTIGALRARQDIASSRPRTTPRPCDPDDIVRCLDRLYRQRRIGLEHARILRIWGERQSVPHAGRPGLRDDAVLWREAMRHLEFPLRMKGIVA